MSNVKDIAIVGLGAAGAMAIYRISQKYPALNVLGIDLGRPPAKRRRQLEGWLGCLPAGDGKFYQNDLEKLGNITQTRKIAAANKWVTNVFQEVSNFKLIKDKDLNSSLEKKLKKNGYHYYNNNYIQLFPKEIHALSKKMSNKLDNCKNIEFCFDSEVLNITKQKSTFTIETEHEEYKCKKIIICTGRSGWRWAHELYKSFGIIEENDISKLGIRIEVPTTVMKEFHGSNCTIIKDNGEIEIGPLSWNGTVIPEDHVDFVTSSFRSNEDRWESDKVSFNFIANINNKNEGAEKTDRLAKLLFLICNDRIAKDKVSAIIANKAKISILEKDFDWIKSELEQFNEIIPELINKGYYYVPAIIPLPGKINIGNNLESEIEGLFVAGENLGITGLYNAVCSGVIAADSACKAL